MTEETNLTAVSGSSNTVLGIDGTFNPFPGETPKENQAYMIDWTKLNSVNDLILILQMLGIAFPGNHPGIEQIKQFLDFENTIDLDKAPSPTKLK